MRIAWILRRMIKGSIELQEGKKVPELEAVKRAMGMCYAGKDHPDNIEELCMLLTHSCAKSFAGIPETKKSELTSYFHIMPLRKS